MHWGWSQFFGWKFSQLGTYLFWTLHLCSYQCPPLGPSSLSWISTADDGYCCLCQTATQDMSCMQSKVCSTAQELTGKQHSSWNIVHKLSPQPALRNCKETASQGGLIYMIRVEKTDCDTRYESPPELPAVSTDHETLCTSSFSPHAQTEPGRLWM